MPLPNVQAPRGFSLYRSGGHREPNRVERPVAADRADQSNIFIGDAYSLDANGNAFRAVGEDAEPGVVRGIVEGFRFRAIPNKPDGPVSQDFIGGGENGWIIGIEDKDCLFQVQTDATGATQADVGKDCNLDNTTPGDTPLHQSRQCINGASLGTAGTGQFQMVELQDSPADNSAGAFARIIVKILNGVI